MNTSQGGIASAEKGGIGLLPPVRILGKGRSVLLLSRQRLRQRGKAVEGRIKYHASVDKDPHHPLDLVDQLGIGLGPCPGSAGDFEVPECEHPLDLGPGPVNLGELAAGEAELLRHRLDGPRVDLALGFEVVQMPGRGLGPDDDGCGSVDDLAHRPLERVPLFDE